ncbi:hypothetical protein [Chryseobacterium sp. JUb7]|uniref:hypothetical protein n=1 Tax=Chryseobacterium sp. JUb7 TaxID=2940599 RepID=UPI002167ED57|nr:hypothetical protein [Chryseobacterium sp. JUb7]MCS3530139.1 hypothetical protein [Chryseobacterium sp. JUb7]
MKKKIWILASAVFLTSCSQESIDETKLLIQNGKSSPTLYLTLELEDRKTYDKTLWLNKDRDNGIELLYKPDIRKYTYLGSPIKKIHLGKKNYILFKEDNIVYAAGTGQIESVLIRNYNTSTWGLSNTTDFNGIDGGGPIFIETFRDMNQKKIIKIRPYN